jgi:hypothetical protein
VRHTSHRPNRPAWTGTLTQNVCEAAWAVTARPIATRINENPIAAWRSRARWTKGGILDCCH